MGLSFDCATCMALVETSSYSLLSSAFIGKTGGSTISLLLRNGCHSFVKKPCHNVPNETIVSELVTNYYHSMFTSNVLERRVSPKVFALLTI
jgi:hypothetical protein